MTEPASRLPARPSLEQLRKQAKNLLRDYRAGDAGAATRVRAVLPRAVDGGSGLALADAQFVLAREYGFQSWAALVHHVDRLEPSSASPPHRPPIRPLETAAPHGSSHFPMAAPLRRIPYGACTSRHTPAIWTT